MTKFRLKTCNAPSNNFNLKIDKQCRTIVFLRGQRPNKATTSSGPTNHFKWSPIRLSLKTYNFCLLFMMHSHSAECVKDISEKYAQLHK